MSNATPVRDIFLGTTTQIEILTGLRGPGDSVEPREEGLQHEAVG